MRVFVAPAVPFSVVILVLFFCGGCAHKVVYAGALSKSGEGLVLYSDHRFELKAPGVAEESQDPAANLSVGRWQTVGANLPVIELVPGGLVGFAVHDAGTSIERMEAHDTGSVAAGERIFYLDIPGNRMLYLPDLVPGLGGIPSFAMADILHRRQVKKPREFDVLTEVSMQRWGDGGRLWAPLWGGDALMLYRYKPLPGHVAIVPATPVPADPDAITFSDIVIVRRGEAAKLPGGTQFMAHGEMMALVSWQRPGARDREEDVEVAIVRKSVVEALQK